MRHNRNRRDAESDTPRFLAFASKVDEWLESRKPGRIGKGFTNVRALEAALFKIRDLREVLLLATYTVAHNSNILVGKTESQEEKDYPGGHRP